MTAQHTETLIIGAGQVGHDDRPSGVLNARKVPVKRNRFVKLSGGDKTAQTVIAAAILRHMHAVITSGVAWDPVIATHGTDTRQPTPRPPNQLRRPLKQTVGASPTRH